MAHVAIHGTGFLVGVPYYVQWFDRQHLRTVAGHDVQSPRQGQKRLDLHDVDLLYQYQHSVTR